MTEIREAMAEALAAIPDVQVSAWMLANPTPPTIFVFPDEIEYDSSFARGHDDWTMTVMAMVGLVSDKGAQQRLDEMLAPSGPSSVKAALEQQPPLGGAVQDIRVETCSGYRVYAQAGAQPVVGAEWRVKILE